MLVGSFVGWTRTAFGLTATVPTVDPSLVGEAFTFQATVSGAVGVTQVRWNFGDGVRTDFTQDLTQVQHTYTSPGHYSVILTVKDDVGTAGISLNHTVHYPLLSARPAVSSDIAYDKARGRVYTVNRDNDSITAIDAVALKKIGELPVYRDPEALAIAPDGRLWVVHRDDYAVAIVDQDRGQIVQGFRLPYASQPIGIAMSPTGDAAYVTLMATGKLLKLNPMTGDIIATADVGPRPRGVSVSADGRNVYVTRFTSPNDHGEITKVDGRSMTVAKRIDLSQDTTTIDTDQQSRGVPNFIFSIALSPDGKQGWPCATKNDVLRGMLLDGTPLNEDDMVRSLVPVIDLGPESDDPTLRMDFDDEGLPTHVEFSPLGDYAFATLTVSNLIEVRDAYTRQNYTKFLGAGKGPRGSVITAENRLFVHGTLSRSVVVFDISKILNSLDNATNKLAEIPTVDANHEKLVPNVLRGKQIFFDASDKRMAKTSYVACASCHFDGDQDGRVWDFSQEGEGLRNTPSLLGRRGTGQGRVRWTGNVDEIQDFESQIRTMFHGTGFMSDADLNQGTRQNPLGDPKAGVSADLDALAAYVTSLDHVNPSPYRNADGTMTADALQGKAVFGRLGCDFCHEGPDFTDSERGLLHDVGTIKATSGHRGNGPLLGMDTPTLLGVWETPPYLHDGSAATLREVITTSNPNDLHGYASSLSPHEIDQLVAYVQQIDNELPIHGLPFDPPPPRRENVNEPLIGGCACDLTAPGGQAVDRGAWTLAVFFLGAALVHRPKRRRKRPSPGG